MSLRLEREVFTPVRKSAWSSAMATLITASRFFIRNFLLGFYGYKSTAIWLKQGEFNIVLLRYFSLWKVRLLRKNPLPNFINGKLTNLHFSKVTIPIVKPEY